MMFDNFKQNSLPFTVGAELEVRLHNPSDFTLQESSSNIYNKLPKDLQPFVHQEFLECMLEFVTPICNNSKEITKSLQSSITKVKKIGEENNFLLATSGSHSFKIDTLKHIDIPRYKAIFEEHGIIMRKFHICGFHIHVGFADKDSIFQAYNYMVSKLPIFLALSCSSAYFDGEDTGLCSYRTKLFEQLPRAGIPYYFQNYNDMQQLYQKMYDDGLINSPSDIWWDLRINPTFGTLEIRICDASNDFERLEVLVEFFQALCMYALYDKMEKLPYQVLKQNKWNSTRYGLNGKYQTLTSVTTLRNYYLELIDKIDEKNIFKTLDIDIEKLRLFADKPSLSFEQRALFKKNKNLLHVEKLGLL